MPLIYGTQRVGRNVEEKTELKCIDGRKCEYRSHGVVVSTQDFESCDPSSNLGGTSFVGLLHAYPINSICTIFFLILKGYHFKMRSRKHFASSEN